MLATIPPFNVVILYDTARSGTCAAAVYERLLQNLEPDYQFRMQCWRFSMLGLPSVALWASRDISAADMVIIAWGGDLSELGYLKTWLKNWPSSSTDSRRALVSLFTGSETSPGDSLRQDVDRVLYELAERAGMDLISSLALLSETLANTPIDEEVYGLPTLVSVTGPTAVAPMPAEPALLQTAFRHGGINE
jgi:hypothetical protein